MRRYALALSMCVLISGCGADQEAGQQAAQGPAAGQATAAGLGLVTYTETREPCADFTPLRKALWGDLHVHTSYSFDAAANSIGTTPVDANRFAQGEAIPFFPLDDAGKPIGSISIDRPLDFLAVTDHGEFLGERALCRTPDSPRYTSEFCTAYRSSERQGMRMLGAVITTEHPVRIPTLCGEDGALCRQYARGPWERIIAAAEEANDRSAQCRFSSFVAYEYTGTPGTSNYHRNVIFRNGNVPDLPVSYIDAPIDSKLWAGLDRACDASAGCDYLTIPHNSNLANGKMGPYMGMEPTLANKRAYAQTRLDREPIMEIFQHKGGSECINGLTSVLAEPDELCEMEAVRHIGRARTIDTVQLIDGKPVPGTTDVVTEPCGDKVGDHGMVGAGCVSDTDFIRSGLLVGLAEEQETGINPIKLGMIASTDTHSSTPGAVSETDWRGHVSVESTPQERLKPGLLTSGIDGNPGGLAGVWAVENSRDAIFEAMQRREVFGTSGPRITPRFFAGWGYSDSLCAAANLIEVAYADGVPMGGDLRDAPPGAKPTFIAMAARDPDPAAAPLQQLQLVKGWIDAQGGRHSEVISIAGSPDNGAGVDVTNGTRHGEGHDSLCTVYRDESFDAGQPAYYYLRAVENPSARWSVYDCLRIEESQRPPVCSDGSYPQTIQEMAWTSPIWYRPSGG